MSYITHTIIPVTNHYAKKNNPKWIDLDIDESLHVLGLLLAMEIFYIHGPRHLYWLNSEHTLFTFMKFGEVMSIKRFENILKHLQLSEDENEEQQVLEFVAAVNDQFQKALAPGSYIALDESMIKSFHRNLHDKIKIIQNQNLWEIKLKILQMQPHRLI